MNGIMGKCGFMMRAIRSLVTRGFIGSLDLCYTIAEEKLFDLRYSTDTAGHVLLQSLTISGHNAKKGIEYQPTRVRPFRGLIRNLRFPEGSVFVDFGCGKGRVMMLAAELGFNKVVGVEFAKELCLKARNNIEIYLAQSYATANLVVVETDATQYIIKDDENVFYFFHPFSADVMRVVLKNICESLFRSPRKVYILYHEPSVCSTAPIALSRKVIEEQSAVFVLSHRRDYSGGVFLVYITR